MSICLSDSTKLLLGNHCSAVHLGPGTSSYFFQVLCSGAHSLECLGDCLVPDIEPRPLACKVCAPVSRVISPTHDFQFRLLHVSVTWIWSGKNLEIISLLPHKTQKRITPCLLSKTIILGIACKSTANSRHIDPGCVRLLDKRKEHSDRG